MCPSAPSIPDQPPPTNLFTSIPTTTILETSALTDYQEFGINYHSLILTSHYQPLKPPSTITCNNINF